MRRVILESPYAGDIERNVVYARRALRHSLSMGEAPIASHLLYTQVLNDNLPRNRTWGINAGLAWLSAAEAMVLYVDYGISNGMNAAMQKAQALGLPYELREIGRES